MKRKELLNKIQRLYKTENEVAYSIVERSYNDALTDVMNVIFEHWDDDSDAEMMAYNQVMLLRDITKGVEKALSELSHSEKENILNLMGGEK